MKRFLSGLFVVMLVLGGVDAVQASIWGRVALTDGDSYDFFAGTFGKYTGGDLYYRSMDSGSCSSLNHFLANNLEQRGLVDLGVTALPLNEIAPPVSGYKRLGVEAILDHTYVSLVHSATPFISVATEENFIFFNVSDWTTSAVTLDFYYGPSAVPIPGAAWLLGSGLLGLVGLKRREK